MAGRAGGCRFIAQKQLGKETLIAVGLFRRRLAGHHFDESIRVHGGLFLFGRLGSPRRSKSLVFQNGEQQMSYR
jgi:hypothetical protein